VAKHGDCGRDKGRGRERERERERETERERERERERHRDVETERYRCIYMGKYGVTYIYSEREMEKDGDREWYERVRVQALGGRC